MGSTDAGLYWLAGDQHGSHTVAANSAGGPVIRQRYLPFGAPRGAPNALPTERGFLGQTEDDSTGLVYLNARYYDPGIGQFISPDPITKTQRPQNLNHYTYAGNNPATFSDPSGLIIAECATGEMRCQRTPSGGWAVSSAAPPPPITKSRVSISTYRLGYAGAKEKGIRLRMAGHGVDIITLGQPNRAGYATWAKMSLSRFLDRDRRINARIAAQDARSSRNIAAWNSALESRRRDFNFFVFYADIAGEVSDNTGKFAVASATNPFTAPAAPIFGGASLATAGLEFALGVAMGRDENIKHGGVGLVGGAVGKGVMTIARGLGAVDNVEQTIDVVSSFYIEFLEDLAEAT